MRGGGRFGSDYKRRLAASNAKKKRLEAVNSAKQQREKAFSSAPPTPIKHGGHAGLNYKSGKGTDLANKLSERLIRNYTTDVGDATSRTIQDTFLGGKGKSDIKDYSLWKPNTGIGILDTAIKYNPTNMLLGNFINNSDFSQMLAPGDVVPVEKGVSLGLKAAKNPIIRGAIKEGFKAGLTPNSPVQFVHSGFNPLDSFDIFGNVIRGAQEGAMTAREKMINDLLKSKPIETQASKEAFIRETAGIVIPQFETISITGKALQDAATGGLRGIIDPYFKRMGTAVRNVTVPSGTSAERRAAIEQVVAHKLEQTNVQTISGRQARELENINAELRDAGIAELPGLTEARMGPHKDTMIRPKSPSTYGQDTIKRNVDVAQSTHGEATAFTDIYRVNDPNKIDNIMQNDHLIGTGFATWYLKHTKPKVVTQQWRDQSAAFIEWINSGDNMQRVGALWNQVKNGQNFDVAMQNFTRDYRDAATGQFTDEYMSYVSDALRSFKGHMGTKEGQRILNAWGSPDWATHNAQIQHERAAYAKAAKAMKDKEQAVKALIERGFSEEEAYSIIYS